MFCRKRSALFSILIDLSSILFIQTRSHKSTSIYNFDTYFSFLFFEASTFLNQNCTTLIYIIQSDLLADFPVPAVCIQGTDTIDSQHQWTFDDGTLMTYFNWNQQHHQPEGGKGILGISIAYNFTWFARGNTVSRGGCFYICQK